MVISKVHKLRFEVEAPIWSPLPTIAPIDGTI